MLDLELLLLEYGFDNPYLLFPVILVGGGALVVGVKVAILTLQLLLVKRVIGGLITTLLSERERRV